MYISLQKFLYEIYNFSSEWLFPKKIFRLIITIFHYIFFSHIPSKTKYTLNKKVKKYKKNEDCIVIANGPSAIDFDLSLIPINIDILTMNQFALSKYSKKIKSNFHVVAEPSSQYNRKEYKDAIDISLKHDSYCYVVHPDLLLLDPNIKKDKSIYTLKYSLIQLCDFLFGDINLEKRMPLFKCSGSALIALSISLGYKKIYVVGMDQDQLKNKEPINKNFHSGQEGEIASMKAKFRNYYERIFDKSKTIKGLLNLTKIAEAKGIRMYNLSYKKSFIDFWIPFNFKDL